MAEARTGKKAPLRVGETPTMEVIEGGEGTTKARKEPEPFMIHLLPDNKVEALPLGAENPDSIRVLMAVDAGTPRTALNRAAKIDSKIDPKARTYAA